MHNLTKIALFRLALYLTYLPALIFILPFAIFSKKSKGNIFLFLDRYTIGGAQRVYLDILIALKKNHKEIFFTRHSQNNTLKYQFFTTDNASVKDIHFYCENLLLRLFSTHYYCFYINRYPGAKILGSNSTFFYDMLPFLSKKVQKLELLHNFSYGKKGMEFFGLANYKYLDVRILVDFYTKSNIIEQYKEYKVPENYLTKIKVIEPGIEVREKPLKDFSLPFKIFYAGRGGEQKRLWLLNKIAERAIKEKLPFEFHFAGPIQDEFSNIVKERFRFYGNVSELDELNKYYEESHFIILTSGFEGFPMFVKEGMINGCIPIVTALEGNKTHLSHLKNSILIHEIKIEKILLEETFEHLKWIIDNIPMVKEISKNSYEYARTHFDKKVFIQKYQELL